MVRKDLKITYHKSAWRCVRAYISLGGYSEGHIGYATNGAQYRHSWRSALRMIRKAGCWGFCVGGQYLHVWIGPKCSVEECFLLLAHEIAHTCEPRYVDQQREERKAGHYEDVIRWVLHFYRNRPRTA